jgi:prepilin-type processing-associated H-X9-DG protein
VTPPVLEIDAAAEIGVRNSQPRGIGRVAVLGDLVCWNNLGRNVVFADGHCRPRAVFGQTMFPDEDEPSQYDLDIHAILDLPDSGLVLVLNHLGCVRGFRRSELVGTGPLRQVEPQATTTFAADVERTVVAGACLVGSRPRDQGAVGVLVSPPIDATALDRPVAADLAAEHFGQVCGLEVVGGSDEPLVALGGEGHVALAPLVRGKVARARWDVEVGFHTAVMIWDGRVLWAAGWAGTPGADDYDWESLGGGGFAGLDPSDGHILVSGPVPDDVAWGTGGVAVVALKTGLAAVGRTGRLYVIDPSEPTGWRSTAPLASSSLGLAHADAVRDGVLVGFNRGGYRLHRFG